MIIEDSEYGYMCDVATVTFNLLPLVPFIYPPWLQVDFKENIVIDLSKVNLLVNNDIMYYKGLLFLACYIVVATEKSVDTINIIKLVQKDVKINAKTLVEQNILYGNGVFHPKTYMLCKDNVKTLFDLVYPKFSGEKGNKKTNKNNLIGGNPCPLLTNIQKRNDWIEQRSKSTNYYILVNMLINTIKQKKVVAANQQTLHATAIKIDTLGMANYLGQERVPIMVQPVATAAGGNFKTFKVYINPLIKKKYIRKSGQKWYLHENKGKYRYIDNTNTHIYVSKKIL